MSSAGQGPSAPTQAMFKPGGDPLVGSVLLGRYRILKRLGEGGMGTVYLGEHTAIRKKVAVKVLSAEYAQKPDVRQRFLQEAQAASMVPQQNIVEITDYGDTPDGRAFFVMEYLEGEDLSDTVKREGALPWARVQPMLLQICEALQAAHDAGIIHRDMKPENCYRIARGGNPDFVKVLDFGIAKVTNPDEEGGGKGLTKTGMIFGTPEYMSPEQAQGQKVDHRVDIYAMGVIMFELLTGSTPFQGDTFMGILTKHLFEAPPSPSASNPAANIPPDAEAIILKAMQKDRELRFGSMNEMAVAIQAVGSGAAPVAVVAEDLSAAPVSGAMQFNGSTAPTLSEMPGATGYPVGGGGTWAPVDEAPRSKAPLLVLLGLLVAAGGGATAYLLTRDAGTAEDAAAMATGATAATAGTAAVAPPVAAPIPTPEHVKQLAPETPTVLLTIKTNVDAKVVDAVDDGIYGMTNTAEGVSVEKSKEMHKFILRAEGYEDLEMEFIPSRDKHFVKELEKSAEPETNSRRTPKPREREKEVSAYDLPGLKPDPTRPEAKAEPKPQPTSAPTPAPQPTAPEPKPEAAFNPSADATPPVPTKKKTGKPGDLLDPF